MRNFLFTGLILLFSITVNAQIYKWVDENGKTQYTDLPPPPGVAKEGQRLNIKSSPIPGNNETSKSKNLAEERLEFDKRQQQKKEEEVKQQAKAEENKKKCIDAQGQLRLYTDSPRLTVPDGAGGIAFVEDDARQKKIADANKAVATFCK
jgi:single-stranded DNA-binding protein